MQIVARVRPPLARELNASYRQYEDAVILDEEANSITITEFPQSFTEQAAPDGSLVSLDLFCPSDCQVKHAVASKLWLLPAPDPLES